MKSVFGETNEYVNTYQKKWETRSSIRTRPRKLIDFTQEGYFFPEDKQPLLLIKEVHELGERTKKEILLKSFYKYLHDIVTLEIKLINSACTKIQYHDLPVHYDDSTKLSTYTILIDEYYHVYIAKDMIFQLENINPKLQTYEYPTSDASNAVTTIKSLLDEKFHDIFEIIAVCIFETTLVRELVEFFQSSSVHPSIKHYVNDHMNDESRHFGFFFDLLCETWEKLDDEYRTAIGSTLADFMTLYLSIESEKHFNTILLGELINDVGLAEKMNNELYKGFIITQDVPIVKNVLSVLRRSKILDHPSVLDGFSKIGLKLN